MTSPTQNVLYGFECDKYRPTFKNLNPIVNYIVPKRIKRKLFNNNWCFGFEFLSNKNIYDDKNKKKGYLFDQKVIFDHKLQL